MSLSDPPRSHTNPLASIPQPSAPPSGATGVLACVEVGASSQQTAVLDRDGSFSFHSGIAVPPAVPVLAAVPGLIRGTHVVAASNLGWFDVAASTALGLDRPVALLRNDAEAAALGEHVLRGATTDLVYVGLGTGVGGAVVRTSSGQVTVTANLFGHTDGFSERQCRCGSRGCLETVASGWALSDPATDDELHLTAAAVARAVELEPLATARLVVLGGGLTRRHPRLVDWVAACLPDRVIEPSAAPPAAKSAAAWGLLALHGPPHQP